MTNEIKPQVEIQSGLKKTESEQARLARGVVEGTSVRLWNKNNLNGKNINDVYEALRGMTATDRCLTVLGGILELPEHPQSDIREPKVSLRDTSEDGTNTDQKSAFDQYQRLPRFKEANGTWVPSYDARGQSQDESFADKITADELAEGEIEILSVNGAVDGGKLLCAGKRGVKGGGEPEGVMVLIDKSIFTDGYLASSSPRLSRKYTIGAYQIPDTDKDATAYKGKDATIVEKAIGAYAARTDTKAMDKPVELQAGDIKEAIDKGLLPSREKVVTTLEAYRQNLIGDYMPDQKEIDGMVASRTQKAKEDKFKALHDANSSVTALPAADATNIEAEVKQQVQIEVERVAKAKLEKSEMKQYKEIARLIDELTVSHDQTLTSEQLTRVIRVLYGDNTQTMIETNNGQIAHLEMLKGIHTSNSDRVAKYNTQIEKLMEENTFLADGKGPDGKPLDFGTRIKDLCDLVASGQASSDPIAKSLLDFVQDPSSANFGKQFDESRIQEVRKIVDSLNLDDDKKQWWEATIEKWGPKLGFILLLLIQQTITDMAKQVKS